MEIRIFGKKDCNACKLAKQKFEFFIKRWQLEDKVKITFYDLETIEGLTEGTLADVVEIPTSLLIDDQGKEIARWEIKIPVSEELGKYFGIER